MRLLIHRTDGDVEVLLLKHKNSEFWSYVNLTKRHICPCLFPTVEDALEDLKTYSNIISYEIKEN